MKKPFLFQMFNIVLFYAVATCGFYFIIHRYVEPLKQEIVELKQENAKLTSSNNHLVQKAFRDEMVERLSARAELIEFSDSLALQDISHPSVHEEKK